MIQPAIRKNLLLLALGLGLIGFGGARLQPGTSGTLETLGLLACIASGLCFLASLFIILLRAARARITAD